MLKFAKSGLDLICISRVTSPFNLAMHPVVGYIHGRVRPYLQTA